ncbi:MAG: helix-turn-helix domain-containing protein [Candidatus Micrarchaeia archaeon]
MLELYYSRPLSLRELARIYGVSRMSIWRAVQASS